MSITLLEGDSLKLLKSLESDSFHAIISDIPYGIGYEDWDVLHTNNNKALGGQSPSQIKAGKVFNRRGKPLNGWSKKDKEISKEYQEWCSEWTSQLYRLLKSGASCFLMTGRLYAHRCILAMEESGFTFRDMLSWEKSNAVSRAQRVSAVYDRRGDSVHSEEWKGWRIANPVPLFEPILWFQKPYRIGGTLANNILEHGVGAWNEEAFIKYNLHEKVSNIIKVRTTKGDKGYHSTQKPLDLMKFLVELVTREGQRILDPFMGSGTTGVACKELKRDFIGIDINSEYVNIAEERIRNS